MRLLITFIALLSLSGANSQCLEVGAITIENEYVWIEGETYNNCYPYPDSASIEWRFSCRGGGYFRKHTGLNDTLQMEWGKETIIQARVKWHGIGADTPIPTVCHETLNDDCTKEIDIDYGPQTTWSEDGCIYTTGGPCYIVTLSNFWTPVEVWEKEEICISQPASLYYVVWTNPYKTSSIYNINQ